jgi:predicted nicotinamide N-methyase
MPGYLTKQQTIAVRGVDDLLIRSLLDRQQYADPDGEAGRLGISSATWPLFGLLWPSGTHLAARLAARPVRSGERILEVGCGLGLASLVGHRRGADVTASDCHPLAEQFLLHNTALNLLGPLKYRHGPWSAPAAAPDSVDAPGERARVRGLFDLILGSDVLYERDAGTSLAGFIGRHAAPVAEVWIVDPDRGNRPLFNRQMAALHFRLTEQRLDSVPSAWAAAYKGRLLTFRRGFDDGP